MLLLCVVEIKPANQSSLRNGCVYSENLNLAAHKVRPLAQGLLAENERAPWPTQMQMRGGALVLALWGVSK
jgi:hypothetical protein